MSANAIKMERSTQSDQRQMFPILHSYPLVSHNLGHAPGVEHNSQINRVRMPGEVYDEPWRDFAYNRSESPTTF